MRPSLAVVTALALLEGCASPDIPTRTQTPATTAASSASPGTDGSTLTTPSPTPEPPAELPRGGREIFPRYRLFGYSGSPGAPGQGRLGIGDLDDRMVEMESRGKPFTGGRELLPVMELIAVTVHGVPGADGMYRTRVRDSVIEEWLAMAREHKAILLLNIQPGRADFIDEVRYLEKWLSEPDVGVALDPEWAVEPGQIPGRVFGRTTGAELNECAAYLADLVAEHNLPEKVMVYHQLHLDIVRNESSLKQHDGVVLVKSIDGIGSPGAKVATWTRIVAATPAGVHLGFKLFYLEDVERGGRLMTAREVLALTPRPEYILFE